MTCIRHFALASVLTGLVAGGAAFSHAGDHGHGHDAPGHGAHSMNPSAALHHLHEVLIKLDLDDEQVARLHRLIQDRHEELEAATKRFEAEHLEVMVAVHANDFDERAIRKAVKKLGDAQLDMMLEMARLRGDVRAELNEEQKASLDRTLHEHLQQMQRGAMR